MTLETTILDLARAVYDEAVRTAGEGDLADALACATLTDLLADARYSSAVERPAIDVRFDVRRSHRVRSRPPSTPLRAAG
jgi:hypothetical protein